MPVEIRKNHILARVRSTFGDTPAYKFPLDRHDAAKSWHDDAKKSLRENRPYPDPIEYGSLDHKRMTNETRAHWTLQQAYEKQVEQTWSGLASEKTVALYWKIIAEHFGATASFSEIGIDEIEEFVSILKNERNIAGSTINRYMSCLSSVWKCAHERGKAPARPSPWPKQRETKGRHYHFSLEEEREIFKACTVMGNQEMTDYIIMLADTGFRRGELESLDINHCVREGVVTLRNGLGETKNGAGRSMPLSVRAKEVVDRRLKAAKEEEQAARDWAKLHKLPFTGAGTTKLFTKKSSWYRSKWDRIKALAELPEAACMHIFRHTFATRMAMTGKVTIYDIKEALGHKSLEATQIYAHHCMEAQRRATSSYFDSEFYAGDTHLVA